MGVKPRYFKHKDDSGFKWIGDISKTIFHIVDDNYVTTQGLFDAVKELEENERLGKQSDVMQNTQMGAKKFLNCSVCKRKDVFCQGHNGYIKNTVKYVKPNAIPYITNILSMICYNCSSPILGQKCQKCKSDKPSVTLIHDIKHTININNGKSGPKKSFQLETADKIYNYINRLDYVSQEMIMKKIFPNKDNSVTVDNLFSTNVIIPSNIIRQEKISSSKRQMVSSMDTKMIKNILDTRTTTSSDEVNSSLSVIYYFLVHGNSSEEDKDDTTLFQDAKGKYGFVKWIVLGKSVFGSGRVVTCSSHALGSNRVGLNMNTARAFKVQIRVTQSNLKYILGTYKKTLIGSLIESNGRIFKMSTTGVEDYVPKVGDLIYRPMKNGDTLMCGRHPIINSSSVLMLKSYIFKKKTSGVYQSPSTQGLKKGDFDGDEETLVKLASMADAESSYMVMCPANHIFNDKKPGISFGVSATGLSGLTMLSTSSHEFEHHEYASAFRNIQDGIVYMTDKPKYSGKDILTAIILGSRINYRQECYAKGSPEDTYWGMEHSQIVIKNGVYKSGAIVGWVLGSGQKSLLAKMSHLMTPNKLINLISALDEIGLWAAAFFGYGDSIDSMVSEKFGYQYNKAANNVVQAKVKSVIAGIHMPRTKFAESNTAVEALIKASDPIAKPLALYFANLITKTSNYGEKYNDFFLSNIAEFGINSRHAFKICGYNGLVVSSGKLIPGFLRFWRKDMATKIGSFDPESYGRDPSNMSVGIAGRIQLLENSVATKSFFIKIIQVVPSGYTLNEGKYVLEITRIGGLHEVMFGNILTERYFGTCVLQVGKCVYVKDKEVLDKKLSKSDFLSHDKSAELYELYTSFFEIIEKRRENSQVYDEVFGIQNTVFWDHQIYYDEAIRKATQIDEIPEPEDGYVGEYYRFIESLIKMKGNPPTKAWIEQIGFMITYFMTIIPPILIDSIGYTAFKIYIDMVRSNYTSKTYHAGAPIGDICSGKTLSGSVQDQLDAHKNRKATIVRGPLNHILGTEMSEREHKMYLFIRPEITNEHATEFAKSLVEVLVSDIINYERFMAVKVEDNDIVFKHAQESYTKSRNIIIKSEKYMLCLFSGIDIAMKNVSAFKIYKAIKEGLPENTVIPLRFHNTEGLAIAVMIENDNDLSVLANKILDIKITGVENISSANLVVSSDKNRYIVTKGVNIETVAVMPEVDPTKLLCDNIYEMQKYIGLMQATANMTLIGTLTFKGCDISYINTLVYIKTVSGKPASLNRHGFKKMIPKSVWKHIGAQSPFKNSFIAGVNGIEDDAKDSVMASLSIGVSPKSSGTNSSSIRLNLRAIKSTLIDGDVIDENFLMNILND